MAVVVTHVAAVANTIIFQSVVIAETHRHIPGNLKIARNTAVANVVFVPSVAQPNTVLGLCVCGEL